MHADAQTASEYVQMAKAVADSGANVDNDFKVKQYLQKALQLEPNNAAANAAFGKYYFDRAGYTRAVEYYNEAIKHDTTNIDYYWLRGRSRSTEQHDTVGYKLAILDFEKVIAMGGKTAKVYLQKAIVETALANNFLVSIQYYRNRSSEDSYSDDRSADIAAKKRLLETGRNYALQAISSADSALTVKPDESEAAKRVTYKANAVIKSIEKALGELK